MRNIIKKVLATILASCLVIGFTVSIASFGSIIPGASYTVPISNGGLFCYKDT